MSRSKTVRRFVPLFAIVALGIFWAQGEAQRPEPEVHGVFEGDSMFTLLPLDAIPAIREPAYYTGNIANDQMKPDEPVIGIVMGKTARAYSMWQLDSHEIVNDQIDGKSFAVTW